MRHGNTIIHIPNTKSPNELSVQLRNEKTTKDSKCSCLKSSELWMSGEPRMKRKVDRRRECESCLTPSPFRDCQETQRLIKGRPGSTWTELGCSHL